MILKPYAVLQELHCKRLTSNTCFPWSQKQQGNCQIRKARGIPDSKGVCRVQREVLLLCQAGADCCSALIFVSNSPFAYYKHCSIKCVSQERRILSTFSKNLSLEKFLNSSLDSFACFTSQSMTVLPQKYFSYFLTELVTGKLHL